MPTLVAFPSLTIRVFTDSSPGLDPPVFALSAFFETPDHNRYLEIELLFPLSLQVEKLRLLSPFHPGRCVFFRAAQSLVDSATSLFASSLIERSPPLFFSSWVCLSPPPVFTGRKTSRCRLTSRRTRPGESRSPPPTLGRIGPSSFGELRNRIRGPAG